MSVRSFRWLILPLVLYALLFPILAIDVAARLLETSQTHDIGNLTLLLFAELTRAVPALCGVLLATLLSVRAADRGYARSLAVFLLFGVITFAMAFRGTGYTGHFQEWLARSLLSAGAPRGLLVVLFASPFWPLWLAIGAFVRFAVQFPKPLTSAEVEQSGVQDRAGWFRGTPGAGVDVGQLSRNALGSVLRAGWLDASTVWTVAAFGALLSIVLRASPLANLLWVPLLLLIAVAITALRARYVAADVETRARLRRLVRGTLAALVAFGLAGVTGLSGSAGAGIVVFILLTLAPALFFVGLAAAVLRPDQNSDLP